MKLAEVSGINRGNAYRENNQLATNSKTKKIGELY
jgi:hypothetical protein